MKKINKKLKIFNSIAISLVIVLIANMLIIKTWNINNMMYWNINWELITSTSNLIKIWLTVIWQTWLLSFWFYKIAEKIF